MSSEKYTMQSQTEHLQMKYVGAGHAEITKLYVLSGGVVAQFILFYVYFTSVAC